MDNTYLFSNWETANSEGKSTVLKNILTYLGAEWEVDKESFIHKPTNKRFAFIPGGWMRMGMSPTDLFHAASTRQNQDYTEWYWNESVAQMRPSVPVYVFPFLMTVHNIENDEPEKNTPFDILSEAEFEWVVSSGKQTDWIALDPKETVSPKNKWKLVADKTIEPFGIQDILDIDGIACADDWHDSHINRPLNSLPWGNGLNTGKEVHTCWQDDDEEIIAWHIAYRIQGVGCSTYNVVRLNNLFSEIPEQPERPIDLSIFKSTLETDNPKDKKTVLGTLSILAHSPAEDIFPLFDLMLKNIHTDEKITPKLLQILADIAVSDSIQERLLENNPFSRFRKQLTTIVDSNLDILLPLLQHKKKAIKLAAVDLLSVSSEMKAYNAIVEQYKLEKNKEVLEAFNIAVAFFIKKNNQGTLLHEVVEGKKIPEYSPVLMKSISDKPDIENIIAYLKSGAIAPLHFQICAELLKSSDQDKETIAVELAQISIKQKEKERGQLQKIAFDIIFPDCSAMEKGTKRQTLKSWLLLPEELSDNQKKVLKVLVQTKSQLGIHPQRAQKHFLYSRVAQTLEGRKIQIGESDAVYAQTIEYNNTSMPLLIALHDIVDRDYKTAKEKYLNLISQFDIITLYELENEAPKVIHDIYFKDCWKVRWGFLEHKIPKDETLLEEYLKPKQEEYFSKEREYDKENGTLVLSAYFLYKNNPSKRHWLLEQLNPDELQTLFSFEDYAIRAFSDHDIRMKTEQFGNKLIQDYREKGNRLRIPEYDYKYSHIIFSKYVTPNTDEKLVSGLLAIEKVNINHQLYQSIKKDGELSHFRKLIPEEYNKTKTNKDKIAVFEKLWRVFLDDESFAI